MMTKVVNTESISRRWYTVDAADMILGRLAGRIAGVLSGKGKVAYSPNQDHGDHVVVLNSDKIRVSGTKEEMKKYFRHSRYPGGGKTRTFAEQMSMDSTAVVKHAVKGMLPKTTLGRAMLKKLHVYPGDTHPHSAQQPVPLEW